MDRARVRVGELLRERVVRERGLAARVRVDFLATVFVRVPGLAAFFALGMVTSF